MTPMRTTVRLDAALRSRPPRTYRERVHPMGEPRVALDQALAMAATMEDEEVVRELAART